MKKIIDILASTMNHPNNKIRNYFNVLQNLQNNRNILVSSQLTL